jgi:alpha-L-fucosidase
MLRRDEFYPGTPNYAQLTKGHEDGTHWVAAECDVSIRPGWYYHADQDDKVKSVEHLMNIWYGSVGRNGSLLLNLPVDPRGLVHENDVARLAEFKAARDRIFTVDLAKGATATSDATRGADSRFAPANALDEDPATYFAAGDGQESATIEFDLGAPKTFDHIVAGEHIALGQRVRSFHVAAETSPGTFEVIARGTTIGRNRILRTEKPLTARRVRLVFESARACPTLAHFRLHHAAR